MYVEALRKSGFQITVFTLHYPFTDQAYVWKDCQVVPLNGANSRIKRHFFLYQKLKRSFHQINAEQSVDLIHSFWLNEATFFGQKLSFLFKKPILTTAMGQDVLATNRYKKRVLNKATPIVVLSKYQQDFIPEIPSTIIPWGVHEQAFKDTQKVNDLIFIGNLTSLKNPRYFLEIVKELNDSSLKVKVIGSGPEMQDCLNFISQNKLTNVELLGECSYELTQAHLASSKLLIHCSSYESFGMIFIEALACGTQILSSKVGFAAENDCIHALTFDAKKDAQKVKELLISKPITPTLFSVNDTVERYKEIYGNLL